MADFDALHAELGSWTRTTPNLGRITLLPKIEFVPRQLELIRKLAQVQLPPIRFL